MNLYSFIVAIALGICGTTTGYFLGHSNGVSKGAENASNFAVGAYENNFLFLTLLEATLNSDIESPDTVKELMIENLEAYPFSRTVLSAAPFNQEYRDDIRKLNLEVIAEAVGRLKKNQLQISYQKPNED